MKFAAEVAAVLGTAMLMFTVAAILTMPWLMVAIAPGFVDQPVKFDLTVELTRVTFPYLFFMAMIALITTRTRSHQASMPIISSLVLKMNRKGRMAVRIS